MSEQNFTSGTRTGTIGGTLLIILANIRASDMLKTVVLAALGAVVSFCVSLLMKRIVKPPKSPKGDIKNTPCE